MPVAADAYADGNGRRIEIGARTGAVRIRSGIAGAGHEIDDAGRDARLVQRIEILSVQRVNRALIANVSHDDRIADMRLRKRDDVVDAERIAVDHFIVNGR